MSKKSYYILYPLMMLFLPLVISCTSSKNISKPLPNIDTSDNNFIVFGYIDPFINVQVYEKGQWYIRKVGSHGGVGGAMVRAASPVMVNLNFINSKTNEKISYSVVEENDREFFVISLPTGEYDMSLDSTTINRMLLGPLKDKCKIVPTKKIVYTGDLTILTFQNSRDAWIKHKYNRDSIEKFMRSYPKFNDMAIQVDPKCDTTLTIQLK